MRASDMERGRRRRCATHERFVVTSHDNPDGDALGSLLATHLALERAREGHGDGARRPERRFPASTASSSSERHGLLRERPADVAERVLVAVDCAQESRIVAPQLLERAR